MLTVARSCFAGGLLRLIILVAGCALFFRCFGDEIETQPRMASPVKFTPLPNTLYRGQLGDRAAAACLAVNDKGEVKGRYYAEKTSKTMALKRDQPSAAVPNPPVTDMIPQNEYDSWPGFDGVWQFNELSADMIKGARYDKTTNTAVSFDMKKIEIATDCDKALAESRHLKLHVFGRQRIGGIEFVTYGNDIDNDDVTSLHIESGLNSTVRRKINDNLKLEFDDESEQWFECADIGNAPSVRALSKSYLTIGFLTRYECGGAHP